ncbi:FliM/FliN family flagellar motor C-terminal domain-containing protein [Pseudooceanicola sp. 200-1SW]|uniref:FliM/FliN family flagellar motor C-terminal domain-containing protein n=1 Tax=Pseudooceanicola sp. 200-1SW TaxID=3425949 RepID=UPI003D7FD2F2
MASTASNAVLRKKASVARETYQARAMSPEKALRLSLAKSADELLDLSLVVLSCQYEMLSADELTAQLSDDALLVLLDGAGRISGAMMLDLMSTSALVEQNTMGRISPLEPEPRATTTTDAALIGPMIDDVFLRLAMLLEGDRASDWMAGYSFGVRIENVRLLGLALDAPEFHVFRLHIEFGATRQGQMLIALPDRSHLPAIEREGVAEDGPGATVGAAVMSAPAAIDAVLHRVSMPLSRVQGLKVGDLIEVPRSALAQTRLETRGETGRATCLGKVRLGQMGGMRAVRLTMAGLAQAGAEGASGEAGRGVLPAPELSDFETGGLGEGAEEMPADMGAAMDIGAMDLGGFDSDDAAEEGGTDDLPPLGDFNMADTEVGDGDFPAMGELPDLPDLSDLPELEGDEEEDDGGFPAMSLADLPDPED